MAHRPNEWVLSVRLEREGAPPRERERTRKNDLTLAHDNLETNPAGWGTGAIPLQPDRLKSVR